MSTLQITLAIIGGLVLAVVVAQGAWLSRQNKPMQADPKAKGAATGVSSERTEPTLDGEKPEHPTRTLEGGQQDHFGASHEAAHNANVMPPDPLAGSRHDPGQVQAQALESEVGCRGGAA
jgi:hypothetical protein